MNDEPIARFWNATKDSLIWSGAVQGDSWNDLWDEAKDDIRTIYAAAVDASGHNHADLANKWEREADAVDPADDAGILRACAAELRARTNKRD